MFIPITHERMVVARWPWVSLAVVALCLLIFPATHYSAAQERSAERFEAAARIWLANPGLAVDPRLLPPALQSELRQEVADVPGIAEALAAEGAATQAELDARTGDWLASLEAAPLWRYGLVPARRTLFASVSHMFLHGGWLHLLGNLFILYLVGPVVEDAVGRGRFLALYLGCGWLAGQLYALHDLDLFRPMVGASGAIAAVMGAFVVLYGRLRLRYLLWIGLPLGTFEAPAWLMFPTWGLLQVIGGLGGEAGGGVAYWAHVWGFVAGVGVGFALRGRAQPVTVAREDPVERSRRLLAKGRRDEAWNALQEASRANPARADVAQALWELGKQLGRAEAAAPACVRLIRDQLRQGDPLLAAQRWQELRGALRYKPADPGLAVQVAEGLHRANEGGDLLAELVDAAISGLAPVTPLEVARRLAALVAERPVPMLRRSLAEAAARTDLPAPLTHALAGGPPPAS